MINISKNLRELFENHKYDISLPFFHSFPKNCCEEASLILGVIIKEEYPAADVNYIRGENHRGFSHFWIEVGDLIFDITADQFDIMSTPIYGEKQQPLLMEFPDTKEVPILQALEKSDRVNNEFCMIISAWLKKCNTIKE